MKTCRESFRVIFYSIVLFYLSKTVLVAEGVGLDLERMMASG
jgi:hypothetical protein